MVTDVLGIVYGSTPTFYVTFMIPAISLLRVVAGPGMLNVGFAGEHGLEETIYDEDNDR